MPLANVVKPALSPLPSDLFAGGANLTDGDLVTYLQQLEALVLQLSGALLSSDMQPGGVLQYVGSSTYKSIKYNFTAYADPTVNDDSSRGYSAGSWQYNKSNGRIHICSDASIGKAKWLTVAEGFDNNYESLRDPSVNDDVSGGYGPGSHWVNTRSLECFYCVRSSARTAVWRRISTRDRAHHPFAVDGTVSTGADQGNALVAVQPGKIVGVSLRRKTAGTSGSMILDININGTTIFTTQANRPTLAWDATLDRTVVQEVKVEAGAFLTTDLITMDVDAVDAGTPADLSVQVMLQYINLL